MLEENSDETIINHESAYPYTQTSINYLYGTGVYFFGKQAPIHIQLSILNNKR